MRFADIQGHEHTKRRLINVVQNNQVAHAQLFFGPEGSPNLTLALAFATYLNCQNRQAKDACGQCASCLKMKKFIHPDVHFVFPISSTKQITRKDVISANFLEAWRSFLYEHPYGNVSDWSYYFDGENKQLSIPKEEARQILQNLSLKAFQAGYKIMLIWLPEYMHVAAANALLKILEEPPPHTLFLLVSFDAEKILHTVLSRTQQRHISAFTDDTISAILTQQYQLREDKLSQIVTLAHGNLHKALKLVEEITDNNFVSFKGWMRLCYAHDFTQLTVQADAFQKMKRAAQKNFLAYSLHMIRAALITNATQEKLTRLTEKERSFIKKFSPTLTLEKVEKLAQWLNQAYYYIERNANPKMVHLALSLKIASLFKGD